MNELQTRKLPFAGTGDRTFEERLPKQCVLSYMAHLREQPNPVWGLKAKGTGSGACGGSKKETGMGSWSSQESFEPSHNSCIFS